MYIYCIKDYQNNFLTLVTLNKILKDREEHLRSLIARKISGYVHYVGHHLSIYLLQTTQFVQFVCYIQSAGTELNSYMTVFFMLAPQ